MTNTKFQRVEHRSAFNRHTRSRIVTRVAPVVGDTSKPRDELVMRIARDGTSSLERRALCPCGNGYVGFCAWCEANRAIASTLFVTPAMAPAHPSGCQCEACVVARRPRDEGTRAASEALPGGWTAPVRPYDNYAHVTGAQAWTVPDERQERGAHHWWWAPNAVDPGKRADTRAEAMAAALGFAIGAEHGNQFHWCRPDTRDFCCAEKTTSFATAELAALNALRFDAEQRRTASEPVHAAEELPPGWGIGSPAWWVEHVSGASVRNRLKLPSTPAAGWDGHDAACERDLRVHATMHAAMADALGCTEAELWTVRE